ncbi:MAG: XRE family transcriptional regulator [Acidobacteria bacterium]|nr:XRE family transcriptional regulator [Acidobacteriota bacterium]
MGSSNLKRSGFKIKNLRNRLGLSIRDVVQATLKVAEKTGERLYAVAPAQLADAENHGQKLGIHKICALAVVYRKSVLEILDLMGVDAYKCLDYQDCFCTKVTHPIDVPFSYSGVEVPTRVDPNFNQNTTSLLNDFIEAWGNIPFEFLLRIQFDKFLFVYIGSGDNLMYPILRPGDIVKVDSREKNLIHGGWANEYERPIYLVEITSGWRCAWCVRDGNDLILLPHPLSQKGPEIYRMHADAEIVGRVVGGWSELKTRT